MAPRIRQEFARLDALALPGPVGTLDKALGDASRQPRIRSILVGSFALLALLLAAIGIHGLVAADVAARWKEFGIRIALGGTQHSLRSLVVTKTALLLGIGILLGVGAVAASSGILESSVEGLQPARMTTAVIAGLLLAGSALAAII